MIAAYPLKDFYEESLLAITTERHESHSLIRVDGECALASAADLKSALMEGLGAGKTLHLDLERVEQIDITILQLIWAAGREAQHSGTTLVTRGSEAAVVAAREVGFERLAGDSPLG